MGAVSVLASCCVNVKLVMVEGGRRMTYSSCPIEKSMRMETMKEDQRRLEMAEKKLVEKKMMKLMEELYKEFGRGRGEGIMSLCWMGEKSMEEFLLELEEEFGGRRDEEVVCLYGNGFFQAVARCD